MTGHPGNDILSIVKSIVWFWQNLHHRHYVESKTSSCEAEICGLNKGHRKERLLDQCVLRTYRESLAPLGSEEKEAEYEKV